MTEMYSGLHVGQRFASLEDFKTVIRSISVRQHWDLRVVRSNKKSVVLGCRSSPNCYFRVVCRANKNATYITSLQDSHSCRRNASSSRSTPARSEASHVRFLLSEIPKLFDMKNKIRGQDVVDAVKRYHGYDISMRQAQRALTKLQPRRPRVHPDQAPDGDGNVPQQQQAVQQPPPQQGDDRPGYNNNNNLAGNNWLHNQLPSALIEGGNIHQNEVPRNQTSLQQSHNQQVQVHAQGQPQEQRAPRNHHLSPINISQQTIPRPPQTQQPATRPGTKAQRQQQQQHQQVQPQQGGHHAAAQLVLTNFKIEFTCTTCGALNQSFFPNHGNVTGSYIPQHPVPNPSSTHAQTASSVRTEGNSNTNDDDVDPFPEEH